MKGRMRQKFEGRGLAISCAFLSNGGRAFLAVHAIHQVASQSH
jgi:hypothetical protein